MSWQNQIYKQTIFFLVDQINKEEMTVLGNVYGHGTKGWYTAVVHNWLWQQDGIPTDDTLQ